MSTVVQQLETLGNSIIEAIVSDVSRPEFTEQIKEAAIEALSQLVGRNLNNPLIRPLIDSWVSEQLEKHSEALMGIIGMVKSNPPASVDAAADLVKESVDDKINDFSKRLSQRLHEAHVEKSQG